MALHRSEILDNTYRTLFLFVLNGVFSTIYQMPPEQIDVSIKNLLKQVYAAHTTRTKSLEDEIQELKNKLFETTRKLEEQESDCKRCAELEEAFTSCKAALQEQTKWFENFGQKFSIFNNSDNKTSSTKTSKLCNDIAQAHCEISSGVKSASPISEKPTISKQAFLQNLMSLNPSDLQDSLNLYTGPFPDNFGQDCSSLNPDSMILAPDTVDVTEDPVIKSHKTKQEVSKPSEQLNVAEVKLKDNIETNRLSKKRACAEASGLQKSPKKRTSKISENDSSDEKRTKEKNTRHKESERTVKEEKSVPQITSPKQITRQAAVLHSNNIKNKVALDVEIGKDTSEGFSGEIPCITIEKSCQSKHEAIIGKGSMYQVSPSLIPLNKKSDKSLFQNQLMVTEDINDFESPGGNKKQQESEQAWTSCDKRKLKKGPSVKTVKGTSKFKMTLDSLPPNYKKPNFRQTKLSKSIFQPKSSSEDGAPSTSSKKILNDCSNDPASVSKKISPIRNNNKTCTVDFDATCIPDNYEVSPSGESAPQEPPDEDLEEILLIQDDSSNESSGHSSNESLVSKVKVKPNEGSKENKGKAEFEDFPSHKKQVINENISSFDRLPKKEEPNYKYKEATVRKKSERKQLNAFDCRECEKYYDDLGLSEEEKKKRMKNCSRHRSKFAPPATPEHFWELDFPDTQECKKRGYLNETQKVTLKTHRRRPL
ncbi:DNA endonuclease RBBP8 [Trichonephila inaurata madagascariensis]|uniref:DNA endonuclease RBBP8 n=1 Tax=Trichonephila inaurata madagascariensis TaxID=2747483 RepID=A0A8X6JMP8_9ARAC|nr:DNA endonuclease RBBP8 [Trichonephila inaurata madagascariensis]